MQNKDAPIQAIVNTAKIMDMISENGEIGISTISRELEIPKSTVFRIIKSLQDVGFVIQTKDEEYALSYKILNYQVGVHEDKNLIYHSSKYLKEFSDSLGETINLAVYRLGKSIVIYTKKENTIL